MKLVLQLGSVPDKPVRLDDVSMFVMTMDDGTPIAFGAETAARKTIIWSVPENEDFWSEFQKHRVPDICKLVDLKIPNSIRYKELGEE